MAKQETEIVEEVEQTAGEISRDTEWFDAAIPADMIRLPYLYLMQGGSEIDKKWPLARGEYYLSSIAAPVEDELIIIPVRVGKRNELVKRDGRDVEEESYRVLGLIASSSLPFVWTLRGTAKDALRQALGGLLLSGPGLRGGAFRLASIEMTNKNKQSWFVPTFEPVQMDPAACRSLADSVFGPDGNLLPVGDMAAGAVIEAGGDELPF